MPKKKELMGYISDYPKNVEYYRKNVKTTAKDPDARKYYEDMIKFSYNRREMAKKKLASKYDIHIA